MATVKLYPTSDISVGHSVSPSGSNGYTCINDVTADDDTSYLYDETSGSLTNQTASSNKESIFVVSTSEVSRKIYLQSIQFSTRHKKTDSDVSTSTLQISCSINGGNYSSTSSSNSTTSYANYTGSLSPSGLNIIYNSFSAANIRIKLNSNITVSSKSNMGIRITQVYLTATYLPIYNCSAFAVEGINNVSVSSSEVKEGDNCTFTASVSSGYRFAGWYSDQNCTQIVSTSTSYTTSISSDTTLYAKANLLYTVNAIAGQYCTVSPSSVTDVIGTSVTFTCTPSDNMKEFVGWYSNSEMTSLITTNNPYTFNISQNTTIYAKCKLKYKMFMKLNGSWVESQNVYKKVNGVWVLQDDISNIFNTSKNYKIIQV